MNDVKSLQNELIVECNRPDRDEPYIAWLKTVVALAAHSNKQFEATE